MQKNGDLPVVEKVFAEGAFGGELYMEELSKDVASSYGEPELPDSLTLAAH